MLKRTPNAWISSDDSSVPRAVIEADDQFYRAEILRMRNQPILGFAENGLVEFANQAAEGMLGHDPGELIGVPIERLFPQSRERLVSVQNGSLWSIGQRRDGNGFPVKLTVSRISSADGLRRFLLIVSHLSDQSVANSAMVIDCMTGGVTVWDHADRLILWNDYARQIYAAAADVMRLGTPYTEFLSCCCERGLLPSGVHDEFIRRRLVEHREPSGIHEETAIGDRRVLVSEHKLSGGAVLRLDTDITEQRSREIELCAAKERAEAANRSKSTFLANMSHELRTPLNAVIGFSDILKTELLGAIGNPKYLEYANCISDSGAHLLHLVNYILDLSRIEAGHYELRPEPLAPGDLVTDVLRLMRVSANESKLQLVVAIAGDLPRIVVDRRAIRQVLLNVLSNAIKFTPAGGTVSVSATARQDDVTITVADTGIGIAKDDLPRLTKPFEQAGDAYTRNKPGTGLGLAITKQLIELHGGILYIDSDIGKGTTVTIRLPLNGTTRDASVPTT